MAVHASVLFGKHYPNRLFVGSLPAEAGPEDLSQFFNKYGQVHEAKVILDSNHNSKKFGFVTFKDSKTVDELIKLETMFFHGTTINIGPAVKKNYDSSSLDGQSTTPTFTKTATPKQSSNGPLHRPKTVVRPSLLEYLNNSDYDYHGGAGAEAGNTGDLASGLQLLNINLDLQYDCDNEPPQALDPSEEYHGLPNSFMSPIGTRLKK